MSERMAHFPALPANEQERIAQLTEAMLEALWPGGGAPEPPRRGRRGMRAVSLMAAFLHTPRDGDDEQAGYLGSGHRPEE